MPTGPGSLLVETAERATDVDRVMSAVTDAVRSWVGAGPVFVATADSMTGAFTRTFTFDIPDEAAQEFLRIEMAGQDLCSFESLRSSATPVDALYHATDGSPEHSARWRAVIAPMQWGDELRAVVRAQGRTWGYLCLHRERHERPFTARDIARLTALLPAVAGAMRTASAALTAQNPMLETAVLLLDDAGRIVGTAGAADSWLAELGSSELGSSELGSECSRLPLLLQGLFDSVYATHRSMATSVVTRVGRLALVEAAPLSSAGGASVAMVLRGAPRGTALQHYAAARGFTVRESEVVAAVVDGRSTREIAAALGISPTTVQAHLTSVFAKTGVRSRRELASRLR